MAEAGQSTGAVYGLEAVQAHLGCSLLVIEHDMPLVRSLADRLIALDTGKVVAEGRR